MTGDVDIARICGGTTVELTDVARDTSDRVGVGAKMFFFAGTGVGAKTLVVLEARRDFLDEPCSTSSIADECRFLLAEPDAEPGADAAPKEKRLDVDEVAEPNDRRLATSPATCMPVRGVEVALVGDGDGAKTFLFLGVGSRLRLAEAIVGWANEGVCEFGLVRCVVDSGAGVVVVDR